MAEERLTKEVPASLSEPIENLIEDKPCDGFSAECDVLIVGSGYGGAIAAMRLAGNGKIFVFERGKEYALGTFPESLGDLPGHVQILQSGRQFPTGYADALFDFRIGDPISVLVGNGLGGGSLINANVAIRPKEFSNPAWPKPLRNEIATLKREFDAVEQLLGVNENTPYRQKYDALDRLAKSLNVRCESAPIAVTQPQKTNPGLRVTNAVDIKQNPCVGCGNCVTGCNVGAKNTLPMNALPLAKSRGARLYTGATVLSVQPAGEPDGSRGWHVRFHRTAVSKTVLDADVFTLKARIVILAAGTLGSTEILLRSQALKKAEFSKNLGLRFSTNGDVLAFGYAQKEEVNAVAHVDFAKVADPPDQRRIGPTITGLFRVPTDSGLVTVEDGAIPSALGHLFGEAITTAALPQRFVKDTSPAWFSANAASDPLAVHPGALKHSQVLLGMGDDGAEWELQFPQGELGEEDYDRSRVRIHKQDIRRDSVFRSVHEKLKEAERKGGFDGGEYLPNPLWKLMPDKMVEASSVPAPSEQLFTVHPLGGCSMGDDVDGGVVNHYGQVFRPHSDRKDRVYDGLYVMDGSIIPCALGVNPFLTIAALAYRNSEQVALALGHAAHELGPVTPDVKKQCDQALPPIGVYPPPAPAHHVEGTFTEWMVGHIYARKVPAWLIDCLGSPKHLRRPHRSLAGTMVQAVPRELNLPNKLVMKAEINFSDVLLWLRNPEAMLPAKAKLYWHAKQGETVVNTDKDVIELADGEGSVELLALDRPASRFCTFWRAILAGVAFAIRRTKEFFCNLLLRRDGRSGGWRVAKTHANWRQMHYRFTFNTASGRNLGLEGTKLLAYAPFKRNPWMALGELPITLTTNDDDSVDGVLRVDMVRLTQRAPFQVTKSPNTPVSIAAVASASMMMLRVLFQTHFWSFGAPSYPKRSPIVNREPGRVWLSWWRRESQSIKPDGKYFWVPVSKANPQLMPLKLTRYRPAKVTNGSILIIHGLATSSLAFATDSIDVNFATYLCRKGYDVWLLDYRLSIALPYALLQWTMDQIAHSDMPEAVRYIYAETGRPVQVFAHCIGAGCLAMAILDGKCHDHAYVDPDTGSRGRSMIGSLVTHAVHPWMVPSIANHMKINFTTIFSNAINLPFFDSVLPVEANVQPGDVMLDRIAGSLPSSFSSEPGIHRLWDAFLHRFMTNERKGKEICKRLSLFYGYEWWHKNLAWETHEGIADLLGVVNLETVRQIYFILFRRRLTTRSGANQYVLKKNFDDFWTFPTLFGHGADSQLYDPISAIGSCLRLRELRKLNGQYKAPHYGAFWLEVSDCGHMDFLFGKNAYKKVYPHLDAFYQRARKPKPLQAAAPNAPTKTSSQIDMAPPSERDPFWEQRKTPALGPIIGWVRQDPNDPQKVKLRIWFEPYIFSAIVGSGVSASHPRGVDIIPCDLPQHPKVYRPPLKYGSSVPRVFEDPDDPGTTPGYPGTYWIYDITLDGLSDLRLSIDHSNPADITLKAEIPSQNSAEAVNNELHDPEEGVTIPFSRLPWIRHLRERRANELSFLVGSCRYTGSPFDEDLADSIFKSMCEQVYDPVQGIDHVLLVGDQIYADATADMFDTRELREHFTRRYREAYGAPHLRRLLASVPTYMALDDHEFDDNWPGSVETLLNRKDPVVQRASELFGQGLAAAKAYQWAMSQRNGWPRSGIPSSHDQGLWHTFESGGLPFFVMDTRTERTLRQASVKWTDAHIVGSTQLDALKQWLDQQNQPAHKEKPKFIVSGSVLAPVPRNFTDLQWMYRSNDDWSGYPATWHALVKHIVEQQIRNVVFISGDYHLSAVAKLTLSSASNAKRGSVTAYSIVASGLFAPLPFANSKSEDYSWGASPPSALPFSNGEARIEVEPYLLSTSSSHFVRVEVKSTGTQWKMGVAAYDCSGIIQPPKPVQAPFDIENDVVGWTL